ncbi:Putative new IS transposase protein B, IS3 family [Metamycoplasma auris 15026]|uniref:Putative new IS transposase protein B, IS3 family n=1 Tax=Metamycoplasma auris 15026 TaxID=1188233 RepID=N9VAE3_9BACT|nr:Putative new IS transposase protein B, IS3 family [Metamycoplasma auris 15026]
MIELEQEFPAIKKKFWLQVLNIKKSAFYEFKKSIALKGYAKDRYAEITSKIIEIFNESKEIYGHKRVHMKLKQMGYKISKKKTLELMKKHELVSVYNRKRRSKYSSYAGTISKISENHIKRNFVSNEPYKKIFGDLTEFKVNDNKLYLQLYKDAFNGEIVGFNYGLRPTVEMTNKALLQFIDKVIPGETIIHTDQGLHYQHHSFSEILEANGVTQSMSRKGNCLDNASMENLIGIMKKEMFYNRKFKNIEELVAKIEEWIPWYNTERISYKTNGVSPVEFRDNHIG